MVVLDLVPIVLLIVKHVLLELSVQLVSQLTILRLIKAVQLVQLIVPNVHLKLQMELKLVTVLNVITPKS